MMLIDLVLDGFMFAHYLILPFIRILRNLFPLTYFIPIARGIVTKGIGVSALWEQIAALVVYVVPMELSHRARRPYPTSSIRTSS